MEIMTEAEVKATMSEFEEWLEAQGPGIRLCVAIKVMYLLTPLERIVFREHWEHQLPEFAVNRVAELIRDVQDLNGL